MALGKNQEIPGGNTNLQPFPNPRETKSLVIFKHLILDDREIHQFVLRGKDNELHLSNLIAS